MDVSTVKNPSVAPKQAPKHVEQVKRSPVQPAQHSEPKAKAEVHKPSPVVNTQGHQTGRLLNVVA